MNVVQQDCNNCKYYNGSCVKIFEFSKDNNYKEIYCRQTNNNTSQ